MVRRVYTVERHLKLARAAEARFQKLGYNNIQVHVGDGTLGWAEHAPYDGIVATAGGPKVPQALLDQLKRGGRLVMPVGRTIQLQELVRVRRSRNDGYRQEELGSVRFVPLVGEAGWQRA